MSENKVVEMTPEQIEIYNRMLAEQNEKKEETEKQNETLSSGREVFTETVVVKEELVFEDNNQPESINGHPVSENKEDLVDNKHLMNTETLHEVKDFTEEVVEDAKVKEILKEAIKETVPQEEEESTLEDGIEDLDVSNFIQQRKDEKPEGCVKPEELKESVEETVETTKEESSETEKKKSESSESKDAFSEISDVIVEEIPSPIEKDYNDIILNLTDLTGYDQDKFDFGIFAGKSKYQFKSNSKNDLNMSSVMKFMANVKSRSHESAVKRGMFIDYYIPMSNLTFRTYEMSNDIVLSQLQTLLGPDLQNHKDEGDNVTNEEFLDIVLKHSDVLCADSEILTDFSIKNKISNSDVEVMKLAVGVMMYIIKNDTKDERKGVYIDPEVKFDSLSCEKCQHVDGYKVNMRDALKSIYTPEVIEHAMKNFSFEKSFDELISSSLRARGKGANYLDQDTNTLFRATVADPSYDDMKSDYNKMYDYIINKYESYVPEDRRSEFYERNTLRDKYMEMVMYIGSINGDLAQDIERDFQGLVIYSYVREIFMYEVPDEMVGRKITKDDLVILQKKHLIEPSYSSFDSTVEDFLNILSILPKKFIENIGKSIRDCQKNQKSNFEIKYKCTKCGHENKGFLDGTTLVGFRTTQQLGNLG